MIYTLTLNPAIDYVVHIDALTVGSISRSKKEAVFFGGKGINVSLVLNELGVPSTALGFIAGFTGEAIEKGISKENIATDFVKLKDGFSRISVKIRDGRETDINGAGPEIEQSDKQRLNEKLNNLKKGDILVLAGSVPKSLPNNIYEKIMEFLSGRGVLFVVDAEGELLLNTLKYTPFLVKPNADELGQLFGVKIDTKEKALFYAKKLQRKGAANVLVSMGEKGAVLVDSEGNFHLANPHTIECKNTVGAGDSMVAGFLAGFIQKRDFGYALKLGNACGAATAFSEGLCTKKDIEKLI